MVRLVIWDAIALVLTSLQWFMQTPLVKKGNMINIGNHCSWCDHYTHQVLRSRRSWRQLRVGWSSESRWQERRPFDPLLHPWEWLQNLDLHLDTPGYRQQINPWWRHQMEAFSALLTLRAGNSPVRWIPRTKASDAELWCFCLSVPK